MNGKRALNKVLYCVLDWGLGHASRSIPLIKLLQNRSVEVVIASNGKALSLLKKEFTTNQFIELSDYQVSYSQKGYLLPFKMLSQLHYIDAAIKKEHTQINSIVEQHQFDLIISDNRYGCFSKQIPSILITHQLQIKSPWLASWVNSTLSKKLQPFNHLWVPDFNHQLSGELSKTSKQIEEIGWLSPYYNNQCTEDIDFLIVLSGPEPQRSILEEKLLNCLPKKHKIVLVRGTNKSNPKLTKHIESYDMVEPTRLNELLNRAKVVISRSGYSSIMDYKVLGKKAILIPTPGQPEQKYLAKHLIDHKQFKSINQTDISEEIFSNSFGKFEAKKSPNINAEAIENALLKANFILKPAL